MPAAIYGMITRRQNSGKAYSVRCSDKWGIEMTGLLPRDGNSSAQMENAIKEFQIEKTCFPTAKPNPPRARNPLEVDLTRRAILSEAENSVRF